MPSERGGAGGGGAAAEVDVVKGLKGMKKGSDGDEKGGGDETGGAMNWRAWVAEIERGRKRERNRERGEQNNNNISKNKEMQQRRRGRRRKTMKSEETIDPSEPEKTTDSTSQ